MTTLRQLGAGLLLAIISLGVVVGSFSLAFAEGNTTIQAAPSLTATLPVFSTSVATLPAMTQLIPSATMTGVEVNATPTETSTSTPPPTPSSCVPPAGWVAVMVQTYDTLQSLADIYQVSVQSIMGANCLFSDQLVVGSYLYVPPMPTATLVKCGPPFGWIRYVVLPGDTLFNISLRYRTTVAELQRANCLGNSSYIQAGKAIFVPNVIPSTAVPTIAPSSTFTPVEPTAVPPTLTSDVPTLTSEPPTATLEPTIAPTATLEPPTSTPVPPSPTTQPPAP